MVLGLSLVAASLALAAVSLGQPTTGNAPTVLSNNEARKVARNPVEATAPPGLSPSEFSVRISVGADGEVRDVSNAYSLPEALFAAAADAARHWYFRYNGGRGKPKAFEAEITFHGPLTGTVTTKDGVPLEGVKVSGGWICCPSQRDTVTTDESGSFRIEHPGTVLHFLPSGRFQPQAIVVDPQASTLNVALAPESSLLLSPCSTPQPGFERVGEGEYGLQFDVPQRDARVFRGKEDVDYVVDIVKAKHGDDRVEFWFGPYAMSPTPDDSQFVESETFATRNVVMPPNLVEGSNGGVIGGDNWGRLPNGKMWRHAAIGLEGARYEDVSPENAAVFDRIINSACWIPDRRR